MAESELYFALLRITAAQALRAAGLTTCKPSVLDAFTDIFSRYIKLLGNTTRDFSERRGALEPDISDVRAALEHVGLIRPMNVFGDPLWEDTRGVDGFIEWCRGPVPAEMRRVAGMAMVGGGDGGVDGGVGGVGGAAVAAPGFTHAGGEVGGGGGDGGGAGGGGGGAGNTAASGGGPVSLLENADATKGELQIPWFNSLKHKPERWRGTALGPTQQDECKPIKIEGGASELEQLLPPPPSPPLKFETESESPLRSTPQDGVVVPSSYGGASGAEKAGTGGGIKTEAGAEEGSLGLKRRSLTPMVTTKEEPVTPGGLGASSSPPEMMGGMEDT